MPGMIKGKPQLWLKQEKRRMKQSRSPSTQEAETGESRVPGHPGSIGSSSLT